MTHKTCIQRAKVSYEEGKMTGSSHDVKQKAKGRPIKYDAISISASSSERATRSEIFDKEMCIIYQKDKADKLHDVSTENMGAHLKAIAQETDSKLLKVRLSNVIGTSYLLRAVTEDMQYHLLCLSHAKRDI